MSCDVAKFTITKDLDNTFVFTIKADGSTLPMVIEAADTFTASLVNLETDSVVDSWTKGAGIEVTNAGGGQITLTILSAETTPLVKERGSKADRYYVRPTHQLVIDCTTTNNGKFIAKVPEIYVD